MQTVLTAGHAGSQLDGLRALLAQAGAAVGIDTRPTDLAGGLLEAQLSSGAFLVLGYLPPMLRVGGALKAAVGGVAPAVADLLDSWHSEGELMLALAVRHPAQCLMVNAEAALAAPERLLAAAGQALGLPFAWADKVTAPPAVAALSSLEALLAGALVAADRQADGLFSELESCAHLAANAEPAIEHLAIAAWVEYEDAAARAADLTARLSIAEQQKAGAIADAQAHASQLVSECEARLAVMKLERDRHSDLAIKTAEIAEAREAELARQTAQARHLQQEGEALLIQLHDAHLESETYAKQADDARTEALAARQEAESARQDADIARHEAANAFDQLAAIRKEAHAAKQEAQVEALAARWVAESARQDVESSRQHAELARRDADIARHEAANAFDQLAATRKEAHAAKQEAQVARLVADGASNDSETLRSALEAARESASALKVQLLVHAGALKQTQEAMAKLEAEHAETKAVLASLQAGTEGHREIRLERDRIRLRLMQLNADASSLQERADRVAERLAESEAARRGLRTFWRDHQPNPVCIDLRKPIDGKNWYEAEADGRWTGPERHSTLSVPPLKPGRYSVQITMAGAMTRDIAAGLRVELNGRPLELSFNRIKHPRVAVAVIEAVPALVDGAWVLGFHVPDVRSPNDRNGADRRSLGVRVTEVKFISDPVKS